MKTTILGLSLLTSPLLASAMPTSSSFKARNDCPDGTPPYAVANLIAYDQTTHSQHPFNVPIATLYNGTGTLITTISLVGAETNVPGETIDVNQITCQRYKDQYGLQRGSAAFTVSTNASVSTNEVDLAYILCYVDATPTS